MTTKTNVDDLLSDLAELIDLLDSRSDIDDFGSANESMRMHAVVSDAHETIRRLSTPPPQASVAEGPQITIGATRCYGSDWFREHTVNGVMFLSPLDQQDEARYVLARFAAPTPPKSLDSVNERCQKVMRARNKPYPRTCYVCGLGPCKETVESIAALSEQRKQGV